MINQPHTLFISDLHLQESQPEITEKFIYFLENYAPLAESIYILGDLFEAWIGDDDTNEFNDSIGKKILQLSQKEKTIYFIHGNRDFLLGEKFAKQSGMQLLTDPTLIHLYSQSILLTHGDSLCTLDTAHQRFRKMTQNKITKTMFLALPLFMRKKIGLWLRSKSKTRTGYLQNNIMDVTDDTVMDSFKKYNMELLIHGHTHRPGIHSYPAGQKRIVLGAWHEQGNMLVLYKNGEQKLVNF